MPPLLTKPQCSLPFSKQLDSGCCSDLPLNFKIHFSIFFRSTLSSSKWVFSYIRYIHPLHAFESVVKSPMNQSLICYKLMQSMLVQFTWKVTLSNWQVLTLCGKDWFAFIFQRVTWFQRRLVFACAADRVRLFSHQYTILRSSLQQLQRYMQRF